MCISPDEMTVDELTRGIADMEEYIRDHPESWQAREGYYTRRIAAYREYIALKTQADVPDNVPVP